MTQSSYLMSFIRNLMENSSKDVREKKKKQLETDFSETGSVLNTCLVERFEEVTKVLNVYNAVSSRVSANISAVNKIKRDLLACKTLLYCNREELRRLWIELVEQRACIELLDTLALVQSAPDAISTLVTARAWSEATELILRASELLNSDIAVIPALVSVKTSLAHKHKFIADHLKKQLLSVLYDRPVSLVLEKYTKHSSTQKSGMKHHDTSPTQQKSPCFLTSSQFASLPLASWHTTNISPPIADPNLHKNPLIAAQSIAANVSAHYDQNASQLRASDEFSDVDWTRELIAVVHCLARLDKLPQILACWAPQYQLSQLQHSVSGSTQPIFSAPLVPGQGLLGELHRFIVLKAVNAVESEAIAQGDKELLCEFSSPKYLILLLHLIFNALFIQTRACLLVIRTMKAINPVSSDSAEFALSEYLISVD
ncbi:unnamed protein product [Dicrocoelium dendriticum]|nr:unnamed protein product [Dicrocoelium dendriticum]